jgi:hypothetical protein
LYSVTIFTTSLWQKSWKNSASMAKASSTHSFSVHLRAASFLHSSCPRSLVRPPSLSLSLSLLIWSSSFALANPDSSSQFRIPIQFLIPISHPNSSSHCVPALQFSAVWSSSLAMAHPHSSS